MATQVFPCIISALWSAGDLFSSICGVTSLKPNVEFIQPFEAFLFPLCFIIFLSFVFFSFWFKALLAFGVGG